MQTSNFAQLRSGKIQYPVSICRFPPRWYKGPRYYKLAPTAEMLARAKRAAPGSDEEARYFIEFEDQLRMFAPAMVVQELQAFYPGVNPEEITLLCFEVVGKPCHRHLVAEWLTEAGFPTQEFQDAP